MHFTARHGKTEVAKVLINNGANVNAVNEVSIKYSLYYMLRMCPLQPQCNQLPL